MKYLFTALALASQILAVQTTTIGARHKLITTTTATYDCARSDNAVVSDSHLVVFRAESTYRCTTAIVVDIYARGNFIYVRPGTTTKEYVPYGSWLLVASGLSKGVSRFMLNDTSLINADAIELKDSLHGVGTAKDSITATFLVKPVGTVRNFANSHILTTTFDTIIDTAGFQHNHEDDTLSSLYANNGYFKGDIHIRHGNDTTHVEGDSIKLPGANQGIRVGTTTKIGSTSVVTPDIQSTWKTRDTSDAVWKNNGLGGDANDVLTWSGTAWAPSPPTGGLSEAVIRDIAHDTSLYHHRFYRDTANKVVTDTATSLRTTLRANMHDTSLYHHKFYRDTVAVCTSANAQHVQGKDTTELVQIANGLDADANDVLTWSGTAWAPSPPTGGITQAQAGAIAHDTSLYHHRFYRDTANKVVHDTADQLRIDLRANMHDTGLAVAAFVQDLIRDTVLVCTSAMSNNSKLILGLDTTAFPRLIAGSLRTLDTLGGRKIGASSFTFSDSVTGSLSAVSKFYLDSGWVNFGLGNVRTTTGGSMFVPSLCIGKNNLLNQNYGSAVGAPTTIFGQACTTNASYGSGHIGSYRCYGGDNWIWTIGSSNCRVGDDHSIVFVSDSVYGGPSAQCLFAVGCGKWGGTNLDSIDDVGLFHSSYNIFRANGGASKRTYWFGRFGTVYPGNSGGGVRTLSDNMFFPNGIKTTYTDTMSGLQYCIVGGGASNDHVAGAYSTSEGAHSNAVIYGGLLFGGGLRTQIALNGYTPYLYSPVMLGQSLTNRSGSYARMFGYANVVDSLQTNVSGREPTTFYHAIDGGEFNYVSADSFATVYQSRACSVFGATTFSNFSTVGGGYHNVIQNAQRAYARGENNRVTANWGTAIGDGNTVSGVGAWAMGRGIQDTTAGAFVFYDSSLARGARVGINQEDPLVALDVTGTARVTSKLLAGIAFKGDTTVADSELATLKYVSEHGGGGGITAAQAGGIVSESLDARFGDDDSSAYLRLDNGLGGDPDDVLVWNGSAWAATPGGGGGLTAAQAGAIARDTVNARFADADSLNVNDANDTTRMLPSYLYLTDSARFGGKIFAARESVCNRSQASNPLRVMDSSGAGNGGLTVAANGRVAIGATISATYVLNMTGGIGTDGLINTSGYLQSMKSMTTTSSAGLIVQPTSTASASNPNRWSPYIEYGARAYDSSATTSVTHGYRYEVITQAGPLAGGATKSWLRMSYNGTPFQFLRFDNRDSSVPGSAIVRDSVIAMRRLSSHGPTVLDSNLSVAGNMTVNRVGIIRSVRSGETTLVNENWTADTLYTDVTDSVGTDIAPSNKTLTVTGIEKAGQVMWVHVRGLDGGYVTWTGTDMTYQMDVGYDFRCVYTISKGWRISKMTAAR